MSDDAPKKRGAEGHSDKYGSNKRLREVRKDRQYKSEEYVPKLDENGNPIPKSERKPKKKVACMIGYCGTGYNGMQIQNNPGVKTIEGEIFEALIKAGAVSPENSDDLKKNGFMRAARTDKGVHAAGNVISCKLIIEDPEILKKINDNLPDQIRFWAIERTNKSFDCRKMCGLRVYEYLLPTYSLLPPKTGSHLSNLLAEDAQNHPGFYRQDNDAKWWEETSAKTTALQQELNITDMSSEDPELVPKIRQVKGLENECRRKSRLSTEKLELFRSAMQKYEGSHVFHNYTIGKSFKDPSARRYMKLTSVSEPFTINDTEWVSIKIHGQSFMLHQIRKMISMACLLVRCGVPLERIDQTFSSVAVNIPKAPALGLLLENPVYDGCNSLLEKYGYNGINFSRYQEEMDAFKMRYIYDKIYAEEHNENSFHGFFSFIDNLKHDDKEFNVFKFLRAGFEAGSMETKQVGEVKFDNVD